MTVGGGGIAVTVSPGTVTQSGVAIRLVGGGAASRARRHCRWHRGRAPILGHRRRNVTV